MVEFFSLNNTAGASELGCKRMARSLSAFDALFIRFIVVIIPIILILNAQISAANTVYEDYEECRDHEMFGNLSLICDPEHKLQRSTLRSLDNLLRDLQNKIACECSNRCERGNGRSNKYIGLLIVTTTPKINSTTFVTPSSANDTDNNNNATVVDGVAIEGVDGGRLGETAKMIYEDAKLGDEKCDNGLLILYIKDQQKLATYRGHGRFALLNDDDMKRLYQLARKSNTRSRDALAGDADSDGVAVQYLLSNYEDKPRGNEKNILRAESWEPVVGLTLALLIVLLILAVLLSFLLARLCCCCCKKKSERADKYYVSRQPSSYKTIEPIYIVTPPISEHGAIQSISSPSLHPHHPHYAHPHPYAHHQNQYHSNRHSLQHHSPSSLANGDYSIYNSPYGVTSTPLPPPPSAQLPPQHMGPIVTHPPRSRSITPTSMHRTKIYPQQSTSSTRGSQTIRSPEQTPKGSKRDWVDKRLISAQNNSAHYAPAGYSGSPFSAGTPHDGDSTTPARHSSQMQLVPHENSSSGDSESGGELPPLPFLDPHRKREVQTKREFIS